MKEAILNLVWCSVRVPSIGNSVLFSTHSYQSTITILKLVSSQKQVCTRLRSQSCLFLYKILYCDVHKPSQASYALSPNSEQMSKGGERTVNVCVWGGGRGDSNVCDYRGDSSQSPRGVWVHVPPESL